MPEKISVYFNNNFHAVFTTENVVFVTQVNSQGYLYENMENGKILVNWGNVCFIKPYEEREEDEE